MEFRRDILNTKNSKNSDASILRNAMIDAFAKYLMLTQMLMCLRSLLTFLAFLEQIAAPFYVCFPPITFPVSSCYSPFHEPVTSQVVPIGNYRMVFAGIELFGCTAPCE